MTASVITGTACSSEARCESWRNSGRLSSPLVEISSQRRKDGKWQLLSFVNHSGQNGTAFLPPLEIRDIEVCLRTERPIDKIHALHLKIDLDVVQDSGAYRFTLPTLDLFETVVIEYGVLEK